MGELDRITLHFALCLQRPYKIKFQLLRMARRYKRKTTDKQVRQIMEALLRDPKPVESVREIVELWLIKTK